MTIIHLPLNCLNRVCSCRGYHGPECAPERYRPIVDRLVEEFGAAAVRLSFVSDYGWRQDIGVEVPVGQRGFSVPLQRCAWIADEPAWDILEHPEAVDALIKRVRAASRGFGV